MKSKASKKKKPSLANKELKEFLKDAGLLFRLPVSEKYLDLILPEYPLDHQLLSMSEIYRTSRAEYRKLGGGYSQKLCSVARSLSSQDLFKAEIQYSPMLSEMKWFVDHNREVADPETVIPSYKYLNGISLFHEQNHRIVWSKLPPAPSEEIELRKYLNFAESIVIVLDLALADQVGKDLSLPLERMKTIYRTGGEDDWYHASSKGYRKYLNGNLAATYFLLELYSSKDIPKGLNELFPGEKKLIKDVMKRSMDLSQIFTENTNPLWQDLYWPAAEQSLALMHADSGREVLYLPENPIDFGDDEFGVADDIFKLFGL